ncbi:MAG: hypothetical protein ACI86H_001813 [bacterium]|jgi:hypothetical protein
MKVVQKIIFLFLVFLFLSNQGFAEGNRFERENLKKQAKWAFKNLLQHWQERKFFELYDKGTTTSQKLINKVDFANRMLKISWKPTIDPDKIKIQKIQILYRSYILLTCKITYEHAINSERTVTKVESFPIIFENNEWRFNLKQLIQVPY